ncbi:hypothetical protein GCM10027423_58750 [Spirosoma arcticum]
MNRRNEVQQTKAMQYQIKDGELLRKILWLDAVLGGGTAIIGLLFYAELTPVLGLPTRFITVVSAITLLYAVVAVRLATQKPASVPLFRVLIGANWLWTLISLVLFFIHFSRAEPLGITFLFLQIIVVGGLAYWEGNQLTRKTSES